MHYSIVTIITVILVCHALAQADNSNLNLNQDKIIAAELGPALARQLLGLEEEPKFVAIKDDEVPRRIRGQSYNQFLLRMNEQHTPWRMEETDYFLKDGIELAVHAASPSKTQDLLRLRWVLANGSPVEIIEGRNAIRLRIDLSNVDENARFMEASEIVQQVMRLQGTDKQSGREYTLAIPWPEQYQKTFDISTNPDTPIHSISAWHDRIDLAYAGGQLVLFIYKKIPQLAGFQDGATWFSDEFREDILAKQESVE